MTKTGKKKDDYLYVFVSELLDVKILCTFCRKMGTRIDELCFFVFREFFVFFVVTGLVSGSGERLRRCA